jgi:hypothetical protein
VSPDTGEVYPPMVTKIFPAPLIDGSSTRGMRVGRGGTAASRSGALTGRLLPRRTARYYLSSALSRYWHALRTATLIVCLLDAEVWALVAFAMLNSRSDAPTKGLDEATGYIVTVLFLITAVPAVALILIPPGAKNGTDTRICFSGSICGPVHHGRYGFYRGAACCAVTPRPRRITSGLAPLHPALN